MPTTTVSMPDTVQAGEPFSIGGEFCSDEGESTASLILINGTIVTQAQFGSGFGGCSIFGIEAGDFADRSLSTGFESDDRFEAQGGKLVITEPGTYVWELEDPNTIEQGTIEVTQPPQPNFSITDCSTQETVIVGNSATVTATVSNTGDAAGDATVAVFDRGTQVDSITKNVPIGGESTYEFGLTFPSPTEASVSVELV